MAAGKRKKRVVIASVLKPVDDTRMAEKIGRSLADTGRFDVHIIGYPSETENSNAQLTVHPLSRFSRLSVRRMLMPMKIRSKITRLRPDLLIITTHELILTAWIVKIITGCKLIYDVQENYFRNISHTDAFPPLLRNLIAAYVRFKEWLFAPAFDHFFLAERNYQLETSFFGNRFSIVENKVRRELCHPKLERDRTKLLFSGTLSESTGVFIAIDLAVALHAIDDSITLLIIGYCARPEELKRIKKAIQDYPFITVEGGDKLVAHSEILAAIDRAGAGIIAYPPNPSTAHSMPTKLYEYLGNTLPILLIDNPTWVEKCHEFNAALVFNPQVLESSKLLPLLKNEHFYPKKAENVYWESEESTLLKAINKLV